MKTYWLLAQPKSSLEKGNFYHPSSEEVSDKGKHIIQGSYSVGPYEGAKILHKEYGKVIGEKEIFTTPEGEKITGYKINKEEFLKSIGREAEKIIQDIKTKGIPSSPMEKVSFIEELDRKMNPPDELCFITDDSILGLRDPISFARYINEENEDFYIIDAFVVKLL